MYIAQRFRTYQLPLDGINQDGLGWMAIMWNDPGLKAQARDYFRQAADPSTSVAKYDDIFNGNPEIQYGQFSEDWEFAP